MKKVKILLFLIVIFFISHSYADELILGGFVRNYTGVTLNDDVDFSVVQNSFNMTMEYSLNNFAFLVNPYINYNLDDSSQIEFDLRQAYIDIYLDMMDIRVGRQQIIWGKADGAFITDVVSPKDLREFLLPEFDEIRMGVTAVKADLYLGNSSFEAIWVPLFTPNKMPGADSIWNSGGINFENSGNSIDLSLENSEIFGRFSLFTSFIDFELMGGYMWDDEPTLTPAPLETPPYTLDHKRLAVFGGSFSSTIGEFVIRGEGAFYNGKYFQVAQPGSPLEKNYINYLAGIDFRQGGWYMSSQFIQKIILDYDDAITSDQISNTMTFVITKNLLADTLLLELFTYIEFNDLNALIRPKISYKMTDGLELTLGSNIFLGDKGTFGQFNENNMVYGKLKFSF